MKEPSVLAPERLMRRVGFLLHKAGVRGLHVVNASLADCGIDVKHYSVLATLIESPCSQVALSDALCVDRTTIVQLIDDLEARSLVQRTVNPEDRRAHILNITTRGREIVQDCDSLTEQADDLFLAPLRPQERAQFRALLLKLL